MCNYFKLESRLKNFEVFLSMVDELNKSTTFSDDRRTGNISLCGLDLQNNAKMFLIKYYVQDQIWAMLVGEVGPRFNILVV